VPFQAIVYNVMVACPSDVTTGLSIASEAIAGWNVIHTERLELDSRF
jgi:hypothetical protein